MVAEDDAGYVEEIVGYRILTILLIEINASKNWWPSEVFVVNYNDYI